MGMLYEYDEVEQEILFGLDASIPLEPNRRKDVPIAYEED
jgi:hypothetical protein